MPLLPLKTQVNETTGLWAPAASGGGGGGGAGPNPVVSTLTLPAAIPTPSGPTAGGIIFSQQLILDDLATNIAGDFAFTAALPYPNGLAGATSTTALTIFAPQNGCTLALGCGEDEVIYIDGAAGGGDPAMIIRGIGGISVSSMTISSINGQVPGGGGGPNPSFSTISLNTNGQLITPDTISISNPTTGANQDMYLRTNYNANTIVSNFQPGGVANVIQVNNPGANLQVALGQPDAGGAVLAAVDAGTLNPSTLTIASDNVNFLQPTAAGAPLSIKASDTNLYDIGVPGIATASIGTVGGRNQFYTTRGEIDDCMVSTITAVAGANITALKPLAVSSIVGVSTINGAAYPPAAGPGITRTTVNTNGSGDILGDGTLTPITAGFTTTAGHLYSLEGFVYAAGSPNISSNASLEFEIGNIDRAYQGAFPMWGYSGAGGLVFGNNLPVSLTWRANSGAVNNLLQAKMSDPLGTAVSTTINAVNGLMLVDYGFVA